MKKPVLIVLCLLLLLPTLALCQTRKPQNKPYIDLRPLHFGISVGLNLQDLEFENVGPQLMEDGTTRTVLCDADTWNPGFSVGVLADLRLNNHFSFRIAPTMHFGSKRLVFRDLDGQRQEITPTDDGETMEPLPTDGQTWEFVPTEATQDIKSTYLSIPLELKFAAERFNNYRPYMLFGVSPMINLTGKDQEYISLKKMDTQLELGMGCDFYLPFFKFIPEIKFCYGLGDVLDKSHAEELTDVNKRIYSQSVASAKPSKMFVISFYFE